MKKSLLQKIKGFFIDDTPLTEQQLKDIEELDELLERIRNDEELQRKLKAFDEENKKWSGFSCGL